MRDERTPKDVCGEAREDGCLNTEFLVSRAFIENRDCALAILLPDFFLRGGERLYTG